MKKIMIGVAGLLAMSCAKREASVPIEPVTPVLDVSMYEAPTIDRDVVMDHPYELACSVERTANGPYVLIASMKLFGGSFYVSPHSTGDFSGKFRIELATNDKLQMEAGFTETPRSLEVIDKHPFVWGPVNWVNVDTRYAYPLTVLANEDFDLEGKVIFTIEPRCTLEEIPVLLKYRSGVLTLEQEKS